MMKYYFALSVIFFWSNSFGQIEQIQTGCTDGIGYLQDSESAKYFIAVSQGIIRYSKASGNVSVLPVPHYPNGFNSGFQIIGDSIFYVSTVYPGYPYPFRLSRSKDDGQTWEILLDTVCDKDLANILVMDTNKMYLLGSAHPSLKTLDGGNSWTETIEVSNSNRYYRYNDSIEFQAVGDLIGYTLDNAESWHTAYNGLNMSNCNIYGLHPKNLDSIYSVSYGNCTAFSFCFSEDYSSQNWQNIDLSGIMACNSVYAISANEVYLVGYNENYKHRIAMSNNLGGSWQIFDPGFSGEIGDITPANDSIFLISGSNGLLYKWNKNQTQWSSLGLEETQYTDLKISPNPSGGVFTIDSQQRVEILELTDFSGKSVQFEYNEETQQIKVNEPQGVYFLRLKQSDEIVNRKLVVW